MATKTLSTPRTLIIGTGNMAMPLILSLSARADIDNSQLTLITGSHGGAHDAAAVQAAISYAGGDVEGIRYIERDDAEHDAKLAAAGAHEVIIFGAKPQFFVDVAMRYASQFSRAKHFISIAAGLEIASIRQMLSQTAAITRTMPHQPLAICGYYSTDAAAQQQAEWLLQGYGQAITLESEEAMHHYTAHAGSGPAFVAEFLSRFAQSKQIGAAMECLLALCADESVAGAYPDSLVEPCSHFVKHWLAQARNESDEQTAKLLTFETIRGTLLFLQERSLEPEAFIAQVRSPRGTTNAGLLMLGNACPDDERFGSPKQIEAQQALAHKQRETTTPQQAIADALAATASRSRAMAEGRVGDPLAGVVTASSQ